MAKLKVLYEPSGKAREYGELALNLINGCSHRCRYCYAPRVMHKKPEEFFNHPVQRKNILELFRKDLDTMVAEGDTREIFLCFTCDPLQPLAFENDLIQNVIRMMELRRMHYRILTKAGYHEFDKITSYISPERCTVGSTLVFSKDAESKTYEPGAPSTSERVQLLKDAKFMGCKTWASLEPVWTPEDAFALIERTCDFVDVFKIGKMNYFKGAPVVDWVKFAHDVTDFCCDIGCNYVLKDDLKRLL